MFSSAATSEFPSTSSAALGSIKTSSTVNKSILCQLSICASVNRFLLVGFRIDDTTNSRMHLCMKLDWDVGHSIRNLRIRILVVGEDIAEGFQRLRLEISEGGLAHRVRNKFFATQGMHRRRPRALLMRFL